MGNIIKQFVAGILAGGIAFSTALAAILQNTEFSAISTGEWVTMGAGWFVAAATGWVTLLTDPKK